MATTFSIGEASLRFVVVGVGGVLVGLAVGLGIVWLWRRLHDSSVEITVSLLTPFAAYLPAEWLAVSGILAAVTAGLVVGWWEPRIMEPETRIRGRAVWDIVVFVLNGLVFILIGLQLPAILDALSDRSLPSLIGGGPLISAAVILVRFAWVFADSALSRRSGRARHGRGRAPRWPEVFVVAWVGMRGVVSLAAALALPLTTPDRHPRSRARRPEQPRW